MRADLRAACDKEGGTLRLMPCPRRLYGLTASAGPALFLMMTTGMLWPMPASPVLAGGAPAKSPALRGSLLPQRLRLVAQEMPRVRLASLSSTQTGHQQSRADVLPRLRYANFRFSLKPAANKPKGVQMASLAPFTIPRSKPARRFRGTAKGLIKWLAYPGCVPKSLKKVLVELSERFGNLTVNSTRRSPQHNREVGGAKHSYHLRCQAVDFRLRHNYRTANAFLLRQAAVGGLKHYGGGRFHIDTGPRRTW